MFCGMYERKSSLFFSSGSFFSNARIYQYGSSPFTLAVSRMLKRITAAIAPSMDDNCGRAFDYAAVYQQKYLDDPVLKLLEKECARLDIPKDQ